MIGRRIAALGIAVVALTVTACGSSSSGGGAQTLNGTTPGASANANGCTTPPALRKSPMTFATEPAVTIARTTYTARIVTNCGTIVVSLDGIHAPHTVNSFAFLASKRYFDDTPCHRLTTSGIYVLQCGDRTGTGTGGPGYTIPDENLTHATYPSGTIAMANTGQPHSGGSQFFLVYANTALPPQYTPFGQVTAGLNILRRIARAGSTPPGDGSPKQPVVIESFTVAKG